MGITSKAGVHQAAPPVFSPRIDHTPSARCCEAVLKLPQGCVGLWRPSCKCLVRTYSVSHHAAHIAQGQRGLSPVEAPMSHLQTSNTMYNTSAPDLHALAAATTHLPKVSPNLSFGAFGQHTCCRCRCLVSPIVQLIT